MAQATLIQHARGLVGEGWTQHADARADDGAPTDPWAPDATSWSLLGALVAGFERAAERAGGEAAIRELAQACVLLSQQLDIESLERWNDAAPRTQAEVVAVLDRAARSARSAPLPLVYSRN